MRATNICINGVCVERKIFESKRYLCLFCEGEIETRTHTEGERESERESKGERERDGERQGEREIESEGKSERMKE